jgi:hypothetical protein
MDLRYTGILFSFALLGAGQAGAAETTQAVARCIGAQGEPMFARQCPGQAAPPVAVPRQVPVQPRPARAPAMCPRTAQELAWQVQAAIHARNGVRLSGLALWRGMSTRGARGEVRELLQLLKAGFADVQLIAQPPAAVEPDFAEDTAAAPPRRNSGQALVITSLSERHGETRSGERWFGVVRDHGCYWLSLQPPAVVPPAPVVTVVATVEEPAWGAQ